MRKDDEEEELRNFRGEEAHQRGGNTQSFVE
jgi:hypothetical protein